MDEINVNVIVIDDNEGNLRIIESILDKVKSVELENQIIRPQLHYFKTYLNKEGHLDEEKILKFIDFYNPGVAIVDMKLKGDEPSDLSGVDLSLKIKSNYGDCCILLISAYFRITAEYRNFQYLSVFKDLISKEKDFDVFSEELKRKFKNALFTYVSSINYRRERFASEINYNSKTMWGLIIGPDHIGLNIKHNIQIPFLKSNSVIVELIELGICGTDKIVLGLSEPPEFELICCHEAFGRIVWVGEKVRNLQIGDYVIPMVRRCEPWDRPQKGQTIIPTSFNFIKCEYKSIKDCFHKADECPVGEYLSSKNNMKIGYKSRGTGKSHGFGSQYFVDTEEWLIKINSDDINDPNLREKMMKRYILTEPLSIIWKTHREILKHYRFREYEDEVLIIGLGPIGLLGVIVMYYLHPGLKYTAIDLSEDDNYRVKLLKKHFNIEYFKVDDKGGVPKELQNRKFQIILEATDNPDRVFKYASDLLTSGGILALIGITEEDNSVNIDSSAFTKLVKRGNIIIGSVNSSRADFTDSIAFMTNIIGNSNSLLEDMVERWDINDNLSRRLIERMGRTHAKNRDEIKIVLKAKEYSKMIMKKKNNNFL